MSSKFENVIARSYQLAMARHHELVTLEHLLEAILEDAEIQNLIVRVHGDLEALVTDNLTWLNNPANHVVVKTNNFQPRHTQLLSNVVKKSKTQSMFSGKQEVLPIDLLIAMYGIEDSPASWLLDKHTPGKEALIDYVTRTVESGTMDPKEAEEVLRMFCINLNERARQGKIDPLIGREKEVEQLTQILARRNKHNPIMTGDPGVGKAQPLDSKVLTPNGWVLMGDIKIGSTVVVPNGEVANVIGVYPQGRKDVYKITFVDNRIVESCKEHLWTIYGKFGNEYRTKSNYRNRELADTNVSLEWIMNKMNTNKSMRIRIPMVNDLNNISNTQLPIDSWLMGFLLGDGSFAKGKMGSFSTGDPEILELVTNRLIPGYQIFKGPEHNYDYTINNLEHARYGFKGVGKNKFLNIYRQYITDLGLRDVTSITKFIPEIYKNGSINQRLDLLAGLVDSDGYVGKNGNVSISTSSNQMSLDIQEIVWSLGGIAKITEKHSTYTYKGEKKDGKVNYNIQIRYPNPQLLSKLTRKLERLPKNYQYKNLKLAIKSVEYSRTTDAQCIMVDHPSHQYITDNYVVTHNTVIVEGLAKRIVEKEVPDTLINKTIWSVDIASMVAGTKYRGDFEERMKQVIKAFQSSPEAIAFIDEIHTIMGAGSGGGGGALDAANMLKPALSRGEIRCIGSTTLEEYRKHFEKDRALVRRFQRLDIFEPSIEDAKRILRGIAKYYEKYHGITYTSIALDTAVELTAKHIHDKFLPDKAIDIIDSAAAWQRIKPEDLRIKVIGKAEIEAEVGRVAKIPVATVKASEVDKLEQLEENLKKVVFGQDEALDNLVNSVYMSRSGLRESDKTLGAYLFTGPTGVGKTEAAKQLAATLGIEFVRIDMSEFQERHTVSKLIGSPPGYVGYGDGAAGNGLLITTLDTHPHCVLLLDEIEKAHPDVFNVLLQVMDYGMITNGSGKTASARNVILIATSNAGAADMERESIGFHKVEDRDDDTKAIKATFSPEFRNRLDAIVKFNKLSKANMDKVLDKFLKGLNDLSTKRKVSIIVNPEAREWLINKGFDSKMGARPLNRVITDNIKKPLSKEMLFGKLKDGGAVMVTVKNNKLDFQYMAHAEEDVSELTINDGNAIPQEVDA